MVAKVMKRSLLTLLTLILIATMLPIQDAGAATLKQGMKGATIKEIGIRLYKLGYLSKSKVSTTFNASMKTAVKYFQITAGITPTGNVDDHTRSKLMSKNAPKKVKYYALKQGANNAKVKVVEQRLYKLGYLASKEVNYIYTSPTTTAVKAFQKTMKLTATGKADVLTLTYLFSPLAKKNPSGSGSSTTEKPTANPTPSATDSPGATPNATVTPKPTATPKPTTYKELKYGLKNKTAVKKMQERLKVLGYITYTGSASGTYESKTATAVEKFQKAAGLKINKKVATVAMQKVLYSEDAPRYDAPSTVPTITTGDPLKPIIGTVLNIDWTGSQKTKYYNTSTGIFKTGKVATIVDVATGICYQIKRKGGSSHADIEPLTAFDAWQMFTTYKNKWSWDRRAIWVVVDDVTLAASINGMPHDSSSISDNNVDGHFCIHFLNSKTHGTAKVDPLHQSMVKKAATADVAAVQAKIDAQ